MYLFVYGTLKRGHYNHGVLGDAEYVDEGQIVGYHMHHLGGFPGVVSWSGGAVHGEVYKIEDKHLSRLDRLEGYDAETDTGMYLRRHTDVYVQDCVLGKVYAMVYVWNHDVDISTLIEDGVWRR